MTELHSAIHSDDLDWVRETVQKYPSDINRYDYLAFDYNAPLHEVYYNCSPGIPAENKLAIAKLLLDHGADVNAQTAIDYFTPLHLAVLWNKIEAVKLFLEKGANPNLRHIGNSTALHTASLRGNETSIELLLKFGAEINVVDFDGLTPLDRAINFYKLDNAQMFIKAGSKATDIFNALLDCLDRKRSRVLKFLIANGAEIDLYGRFSVKALYFSLLTSAEAQLFEKMLIDEGVDVELFKREGEENTELHVAIKNGNETRVEDFLQAGADVNAKNIIHETPLHLLLRCEEMRDHGQLYRLAKLLIDAGADLYAKDCLNYTTFQLAVFKEQSKIVNLMLAKITRVEECTLEKEVRLSMWQYDGHKVFRTLSPLEVSIILGYEQVVDYFIEKRHYTIGTNHNKNCMLTLLYYAVEKGQYEIAKMLLEASYQTDMSCPSKIPERRSYPLSGQENVLAFPIDLTKYDNDNLQFIYLFWEFNCFAILRKIILSAMERVLRDQNGNKVICLLIFYYNFGIRTNKLYKDIVSIEHAYRTNGRLSSIFASCEEQIDELNKDLVCDGLSKFDLLTKKMDSLVEFLNDEGNFKACTELYTSLVEKKEVESYDTAVMFRIEFAIQKKRLLDSAKDCLNKALQNDLDFRKSKYLPDEIICKILSYLNIRELKKMTGEN